MNKRKYQSLVNRAVRAQRLETGEYERVMDEAGMELDQPEEGQEDTLWDRFCADVDEGAKVPLTDREKKMVENRKKREALEDSERELRAAKAHYERLLAESKKRGTH